jgi:hypothetical protein
MAKWMKKEVNTHTYRYAKCIDTQGVYIRKMYIRKAHGQVDEEGAKYRYIHFCVFTYTYMCAYAYIGMYTYTHIYMYIYTCIYEA